MLRQAQHEGYFLTLVPSFLIPSFLIPSFLIPSLSRDEG